MLLWIIFIIMASTIPAVDNLMNTTEVPLINELTLEEICNLANITIVDCHCGNTVLAAVCDENGESLAGITETIYVKTFSCDSRNHYLAAFNTFSSVLGIAGNALVVLLTFKEWKNATTFRKLILGLAVCDLLFCVAQLFIDAARFSTCHWLYGLLMCKTLRSLLTSSAHAAVGFIVIIAVDRFVGIVFSFSHWMTSFKLKAMVAVNILMAVASVLPLAVMLELNEFSICNEKWPKGGNGSLMYTWFSFLFYFVAPMAAASVLYAWVMLHLRRSIADNNFLNDTQLQQRVKTNHKIMKILIAIVVMFFVLVLPNKIYWLLIDHKVAFNGMLGEVVTGIPYGLHAAVNPLVYSVVDVNFRKQLDALFGCSTRQRSISQSNNSSEQHTKHQSVSLVKSDCEAQL